MHKQLKTLRRKFWLIRFSDSDLARIARLIGTAKGGLPLVIDIQSGDSQDSYSTSEPEFFLAPEMPKDVLKVKISGRKRAEADLVCELSLVAGPRGEAELLVAGTDINTVSGLFFELSRELETRQQTGQWFSKNADGGVVYFALGVLLGLAVYTIFDIPLDIISKNFPAFKDTTTYRLIVGIGWGLILLSFSAGGFFLQNGFRALVPPVGFNGQLTDPFSRTRKKFSTFFLLLVLPVVLNVLANVISPFLNR